jgi:mRNA interferase MazF
MPLPNSLWLSPGLWEQAAKTSRYPTNVRLAPEDTGLPMETVFLYFQIRSLDPKRFSEPPAGRITGEALQRVERTVRYCLGL